MRLTLRTALITLPTLLMSLAGATVASAAEGPFWKVAGARLAAGETHTLEGAAAKEFVLHLGVAGTLKCTTLTLEKTPQLIGSSGPTAGNAEAVLAFGGCTIHENGAACSVPGGKVVTERLKATLAREHELPAKGEKLLGVWRPVKGEAWVKLKFEGTCTLNEGTLEGSVAAEVLEGAAKPTTLEENELEGTTNYFNFPALQIKKAWIESGGVRQEVKLKLGFFGKNTEPQGRMELKAASAKWGVFA